MSGSGVIRHVQRVAPTAIAIGLLTALAVRRYVGMANADALLPALISTQQWTLFYWGQDRLASLVPLLATPIRDPRWNFDVQSLLIAAAFFGLAAVFVSYHAWSRRDRTRPAEHAIATGLTVLVAMVPFHTVTGYRFMIEQLYFLSVLVWVASVWAWQRRRWYGAGGALVLAATLLNPSLLLAGPLIWLIDDDSEGRARRCAGFVGVSVVAFISTNVASRLFATGVSPNDAYDDFRLDRLDVGVRAVAGNVAGSVRDRLATLVVVVAVMTVVAFGHRLRHRSIAVYAALPAFSAAWFLAFSTNAWIIQNQYEFRYFYPLYVTYLLFVAAASTELVLRTRRWRRSPRQPATRGTMIAAVEVFALLAVWAGALTITHRSEVVALTASEPFVTTARELDVRLVAGNYWTVWPTVVDGRARGLPLLGVSFRSDPLIDEIRDELDAARKRGGTVVLCAGLDDPDGCVALVNERSPEPIWVVDGVERQSPLVIRIAPSR